MGESAGRLVGADGAVEFDAETAVDVDDALIILPWHAKNNLAFGFADAFDDLLVGKLRVFDEHWTKRLKYLFDCLMKLFLSRIPRLDLLIDRFDFFSQCRRHNAS